MATDPHIITLIQESNRGNNSSALELARVYRKNNDILNAIEQYELAIREQEDRSFTTPSLERPQAMLELASIYLEDHRVENKARAIELYQQIVEKYGDDHEAMRSDIAREKLAKLYQAGKVAGKGIQDSIKLYREIFYDTVDDALKKRAEKELVLLNMTLILQEFEVKAEQLRAESDLNPRNEQFKLAADDAQNFIKSTKGIIKAYRASDRMSFSKFQKDCWSAFTVAKESSLKNHQGLLAWLLNKLRDCLGHLKYKGDRIFATRAVQTLETAEKRLRTAFKSDEAPYSAEDEDEEETPRGGNRPPV